jgi:hypothetical protein
MKRQFLNKAQLEIGCKIIFPLRPLLKFCPEPASGKLYRAPPPMFAAAGIIEDCQLCQPALMLKCNIMVRAQYCRGME